MKKTIVLGELSVEIRGAKYKEVKELIRNSKMLITKIADVGQNVVIQKEQEDELKGNWKEDAIELMISNMDEVMSFIVRFTNLSEEQIEELEVPEIILLIDHILKINRINFSKIYDFFSKLWKELEIKDIPTKQFIQKI